MKGEINMKYRRVITMLASASLAISIPVTSLAAEVNLIVPNEIGTSNHADTQWKQIQHKSRRKFRQNL